MLSDLWQQVRLMIKDSSEGLGTNPLQVTFSGSDLSGLGKERRGCPFSEGG